MIRFEHTGWAYLLLLIPLLLLVFWLARHRQRQAIRRFGNEEVVHRMAAFRSVVRPWTKFFLMLLAFVMMVTAAVNPQTGSRMEEVRHEGVDIIIALDVSRSMLAGDVQPNRLERAKLAVNRLVDRLGQDRVGLVLFAGTAHTQIPLTSDFQAVKMLLRSVSTESIAVQGTDISSGIQRALAAFPGDGNTNSRTIILLSDGESHEDQAVKHAQKAGAIGVRIHTVGIGSRQGAPIPVYENGQRKGFLRDNEGNTVISRYNESLMREIAEASGGVFRHGSGADLGLDSILEEIRTMDKETYETHIITEYMSRFHYFAALALILLLIEMLVMERKNTWAARIRFFGTNE